MDSQIIKVGNYQAIFNIQLKNGMVYMRIQRSNYANDERCVVWVDPHRFTNLWKKCRFNQEISHGNPETWILDKKYKDAEIGFSHGVNNPVPLASVTFGSYSSKLDDYFVDFTNGITRTIWLLAHNVQAFPVESNLSDGALELYRTAGVRGNKFYTVEQLLSAVPNP